MTEDYLDTLTPKECEHLFQEELYKYRLNQEKSHWDNLWMLVHHCCSNQAKAKLKGVICPDFEGKVTDATLKCMTKILDGENPQKLSSWTYFPVIGTIWDRKLQKEERCLSYESWLEHEYAEEERRAK